MDKDINMISCGGYHTLASSMYQLIAPKGCTWTRKENIVYSFGDNRYGQLGVGDTTGRLVPTSVTHLLHNKYIEKIDAGFRHSLVVSSEGHLYSWGYGRYGETGHHNTNTIRISPLRVDVLKKHKVVNVAAGYKHSVVYALATTNYALPRHIAHQEWDSVKSLGDCKGTCICFASGQKICAPYKLYYSCDKCQFGEVLCRQCAISCHQ